MNVQFYTAANRYDIPIEELSEWRQAQVVWSHPDGVFLPIVDITSDSSELRIVQVNQGNVIKFEGVATLVRICMVQMGEQLRVTVERKMQS